MSRGLGVKGAPERERETKKKKKMKNRKEKKKRKKRKKRDNETFQIPGRGPLPDISP